ncbi:uncharacterized protein LOC105446162 [Strongylocentrotus purpuratus]|uniref:Uncharacterized protein n=1 Tax=Strongylocentrotus purpuratus TaxID=7668 RepID=A0A7M7SXE6_STRPU|nr:uncharacterized protein LOC105446162 [Strongylocentrotus purpuratus]
MNFNEKVGIKRHFSKRTLAANKVESCLHLRTSSPRVMADQVPSLSPQFERTQTIDSNNNSFFLDSRVFEKNSSTKESKSDIKSENDYCLNEDLENTDVSFSQVQVVDVPIIPDNTDQTTEAEEGVEKEGCDEPEQEDNCLSEDWENTDVSFNQVQVVDVLIIPVNTQTTEAEEGVEKEGCDEPDGLFGRIAFKSKDVDCLMPHHTILRKYGDKVHLEKTTIRVTKDDKDVVCEGHSEIDEVSRWPRHVHTSALSFISQDLDDVPQIYLNTSGEKVTMGRFTGERARFYLEFYADRRQQGQLCTIRHHITNTLYDAVHNRMKVHN